MNARLRSCLAVALALGGALPAQALPPCTGAEGVTPICGFQRPEDLEVLNPDALLVSEYGGLAGTTPGRLSVYTPVRDARRELYPAGGADGSPAWGAPDCPGPPGAAFSPHGIHLATVAGGQRVLAVNHGGREAIEIFELSDAHDATRARLTWRGCVVAPAAAWLNDVVGLPDGGFAATHMVARGTPEDALFAAERSRGPIGYVLEWSRAGGWQRLTGSDGGLPNGIAVSADGGVLYVNEYFGDRVVALDRRRGERLWETVVDAPDNSSWDAAGRLLVASHRVDLAAILACNEAPLAPCAVPYDIVAIDPTDGRRETVAAGGDAHFGAATVAVELGGRLYLGSFVGDRLAQTTRGTGLTGEEPRQR